MAKIGKTVNFEMYAFNVINNIAKKTFDGNFSKALNWFIYSKGDIIAFYRFMAKYHYSRATEFNAVKEQLIEQTNGAE